MATLHVDIVAAEGHIYSGDASMLFAPAAMGEVGIAPRHAPLLTTLKPGTVRVKLADGSELPFFVGGGILEVQPHLVTVLADTALRGEDADEAAAAASKAEAEAKLAGAKSEMDIAKANEEVTMAAARYEFVKKLKSPTR
ncbi:ATP synthase F1 subcomplex epsilon subunit [Panacagrimonas perspica]|uniref:ATP synthase epsilon chain n=1 Tax=Panacagrimonas perspica TaxID=381431 RepID=A0A4R7NS59_9GAMM|nr:F0F1 ATP synthase subunit epsilon [Panacagrimonas perspica]TDU23270.1 ATP synthase F1 subcomplex epsilon subunit [Panacagrimonas perspica]THD01032.1 F0F1 ATP synthase subunit epsilon [Panacagrimonas perspica]